MFNASGEPVGAQITNYLLEKGRVVGQIENERNFHIFYRFTKGASDDYRGVYQTSVLVIALSSDQQKCSGCKVHSRIHTPAWATA